MDKRIIRKKVSKNQSLDERLPTLSGPIPQTNQCACARILIQPQKSFRFRYKSDGRIGFIPGVSQQPDIKTYPTIEIVGHNGPAQVIVSCVETVKPYRVHPHHLVDHNFCENGYCRKSVPAGETVIPFNFGIQVCKISEAKASLELRERVNIDPFKAGFNHKDEISTINMKAVRLCFQVFINQEMFALPPLLSEVVLDSRSVNDLLIREVSHCSGPMAGDMRMILLCDDLGKESIRVTFFEEQNERTIWEEDATIVEIFKRVAIVLKTPKYKEKFGDNDCRNVQVHFQLRKAGNDSNAVPFEYIAPNVSSDYLRRKRQKTLSPLLQESPLLQHAKDCSFVLIQLVMILSTDVTTQLFPTTVNPQQWLPPFEAPMAPSTSYTWSSEVPSVHQQPIVPSEETPNYVYFSEHSNNYVSLEPANQSADSNLPTSQLTNNQADQMPCNVEVADWMLPDLSPEFMNKVLEALDQADSKGNVPRTRRDGEVDSLSDCFRKNKI